MLEARYNVVLNNAVQEGFDLEQVQSEFARIFKLTEEKVEALFASGEAIIKKDVSEEAAKKLLSVLEKIGAIAHLQSLNGEIIAQESEEQSSAKASDTEMVASSVADSNAEQPVEASSDGHGGESGAAEDVSPAAENQQNFPFSFQGNGGEYFRIWIVNILLTIVTLGIYSAWAKVRNAQYFYGNTELDGTRFAYLAKPLTILKGRILAVIVFVIYMIISNLYPIAGGILGLLFMIAVPWIVVRSLKFNMRMTAWRNVRFGFEGSVGGAAMTFIAWPFFGLLSLGLLFPMAIYKQMEYIIQNTRYGTAKFNMRSFIGDYYILCLKIMGFMFLAGLAAVGLSFIFEPLSIVGMFFIYFFAFIFFTVRSVNMMYSNASFNGGAVNFDSTYQDWSYAKMVLMNSLLTALTLGLYLPWAMVRIAHYKADHLQILSADGLHSIAAAEQENVSALGEELGDVFDLGIGL